MTSKVPSLKLYLEPGRLSDILALIQVLAYDKHAKRTHAGLIAQLRRAPSSAQSWPEIGRQHPELFRVLEAEKHSSNQETVTLIARFTQETIPSDNNAEAPKSPQLTPDQVNSLIEVAIQLHDREVQRKDRWTHIVVPMVVAIVAAGASIAAALMPSFYSHYESRPPAQETQQLPSATKTQAEIEKKEMRSPPVQSDVKNEEKPKEASPNK